MKLIAMTAALALVSGCASTISTQDRSAAKTGDAVTAQKEFPPQVWSGHKELKISESVCAKRGMEILSSLGFTQIVKSTHGEYVYGNYSSNRAAIKCVSVKEQTFVYAIVSGPKVEIVKTFRNEIMWQY